MINPRFLRVIAAAAVLTGSCLTAYAGSAVDFDRGSAVSAAALAREAGVPAVPAPAGGAKTSAPQPFADKENVSYIWPEIVFARGADYANFAYTMSQNRDEVRRMMLAEFGSLLIPMAYANADVNELAKTILQAILIFDGMHEQHKNEALQGLPVSFENELRANLDSLFRENALSDSRRRVEFLGKNAASYWGVKSNTNDPKFPVTAMNGVDFLIHGSYTLLGGANIEVTLTLEQLVGGRSRSFVAAGPVHQVMRDLAKQLFDFFQANEYQEWVNPQPSLTWLRSSPQQPKATAREASMYCRGQGARFPYYRELVLASQGGNYLPGGIPPLADNDIYVVADKQHWDEQHYLFTGQSGDATGGPVRTGAGYGVIHASYWCVKGQPSAEVMFFEDIYRLRRETADAGVGQALECLLQKLDDPGAREWECRGAYPTARAAANFLQRKGYEITLPY